MASRSKKHKALEVHNTMKQISKPMTIMDVDAAYRKGFTEGYEAGREEGFKQSAMMTSTKCTPTWGTDATTQRPFCLSNQGTT